MHAITTVMFTHEECSVFERASLALRVAFVGERGATSLGEQRSDLPSRHTLTEGDDDRAMRMAHSLAQYGDTITYDYLLRTKAVFEYARAVCEIEADPQLWFSLVVGELSEQTRLMTDAIVAARRQFIIDVDAAVALLDEALAQTTPKPTNPKWDDDLSLAIERVDAVMRADS